MKRVVLEKWIRGTLRGNYVDKSGHSEKITQEIQINLKEKEDS